MKKKMKEVKRVKEINKLEHYEDEDDQKRGEKLIIGNNCYLRLK